MEAEHIPCEPALGTDRPSMKDYASKPPQHYRNMLVRAKRIPDEMERAAALTVLSLDLEREIGNAERQDMGQGQLVKELRGIRDEATSTK